MFSATRLVNLIIIVIIIIISSSSSSSSNGYLIDVESIDGAAEPIYSTLI